MKIGFQTLKRYLHWNGSVQDLCQLLTSIGLEVEEIFQPQGLPEFFVVGKILSVEKVPGTDHLTLCQVDIGGSEIRSIICGAPNHRQDDKVVVALPGQILPGGFEIQERKVQGILSRGMLCSRREMGLGNDHEGIVILPQEAEPGESPLPWLTTIEINVTPNRPDCLGWIGIAREVATACDGKFMPPEPVVTGTDQETIPIQLDDPEGCPRYLGRIIRGVKIVPSPRWLVDELIAVGLSPINNVVDITNFVMMELGHPLHAFDLNKLTGPEIRVRSAGDNESLTLLSGQVLSLNPSHLVIADQVRPVALAGIMGGGNSEVSDQTTDLLIECAWFQPQRIRRSSKTLGISTDASFRFERGVDPDGMVRAIDRCTSLILEIAGGTATSSIIEAVEPANLPRPRLIYLRINRASMIIGSQVSGAFCQKVLQGLGCQVEDTQDGRLRVETPAGRPDLEREIDLIEEIARHLGYEEIVSVAPDSPTVVAHSHPALELINKLSQILVSRGWLETCTFSFVRPEDEQRLRKSSGNLNSENIIYVCNPISSETTQLRNTLLTNLLVVLEWNVKHGEQSLALFEIGKVYLKQQDDLLNSERLALGMVLYGHGSSHWSSPDREYDFYDAKGIVETLLHESGIANAKLQSGQFDFLYPGQCGQYFLNDRSLAVIGRLHPIISKSFDLPSDPIVIEIDLEAILSLRKKEAPRVTLPSAYPAIRRDLSLTVPIQMHTEEILNLILHRETPYLESVELFDRYTGKPLEIGQQSLGFRVTYRSSEKTLTDEEITRIHQALMTDLQQTVGARQRGMEAAN